MHPDSRPRAPWRAAALALAVGVLALAAVALLARGAAMRDEVARAGDPLARSAQALATRIDPARPRRAQALLERAGAPGRVIAPSGRVAAGTGPLSLWAAGAPGWAERVATDGAGDWTLREGAVEASAPLATEGRVVLRRPLAEGAGELWLGGWPVLAAILAGGLVAALLAGLASARRGRRLRRLAASAEAAAGGRPALVPPVGRGDLRRLSEGLGAVCLRVAELQDAAEERVEALGAALGPLPQPAAARTPAGGVLRNDALERLAASLSPADATRVETAVRLALEGAGPVSQRVTLGDARVLEVEAWGVPGGRVVVVSERTEQARLATLRRQITGSAARHLQAPVSEVQALGSELLGQVPASAAPTARRVLAAADRMERLVAQLLRGTANDPRARPLRVREVGVAGIAFGLGRAVDRRLRDRGLRLETDLPSQLPAVRTDPALVHEILGELVANSATFTPRGGTITIAGRETPGGEVEISVRDTGPGIAGEELHLVGERFGRGAGAAGFPGAGLGLGVASALAERLGGRLAVEGGPDGRARLTLPAATSEIAAPAEPELVSAGAAPAP